MKMLRLRSLGGASIDEIRNDYIRGTAQIEHLGDKDGLDMCRRVIVGDLKGDLLTSPPSSKQISKSLLEEFVQASSRAPGSWRTDKERCTEAIVTAHCGLLK